MRENTGFKTSQEMFIQALDWQPIHNYRTQERAMKTIAIQLRLLARAHRKCKGRKASHLNMQIQMLRRAMASIARLDLGG